MNAAARRWLAKPRRAVLPGKVSVRLTPSGWGFCGLIFCTFLMSVNYSNNLIFAMTFLLVGIALVGWYHTRVNVRGLTMASWRCLPVFAGQNATYRLVIVNSGKRGRHGLFASTHGHEDGQEVHLMGGEQLELSLARPALQRGRLEAVPATLRSCYPLGIFQARLSTDSLPECLVYPKPEGGQPISEKAHDSRAHLMAESGTFTDMRRYAPGDALSHIHWKAMARFDELYTKEFDGAQGKPALWLRWEDVKANGTEQKLSQLCRWVLDVYSQNREFGLVLPGKTIEPADTESHRHHCLRALALFGEKESVS